MSQLPLGSVCRLPTSSVRATVDVEHFSGDLICFCQIEHGVDNVFYRYDLAHRLKRLERILGIVLVQRRVHYAGSDCVEADAIFRILDC